MTGLESLLDTNLVSQMQNYYNTLLSDCGLTRDDMNMLKCENYKEFLQDSSAPEDSKIHESFEDLFQKSSNKQKEVQHIQTRTYIDDSISTKRFYTGLSFFFYLVLLKNNRSCVHGY